MADPTKYKMRTSLRLGGLLGFVGGFLMAYQRSSCALLCHDHFISTTDASSSPILGLVREQKGRRNGFGRTDSAGQGG